MQTIIGSGGAIGKPLAAELKKYTERVRLVSRNPVRINSDDELFPLDVNDHSGLREAISGSETVYVTIGFRYSLKVWQTQWPSFMTEVIKACRQYGAKLVFFDNIYLYDRSAVPDMTEESLIRPPSRKGEVRKTLHEMIMGEAAKGNLDALIARSADFYGPVLRNTAIGEMVISNFLKDKKARVFGDLDKVHTYTFTPDAAKAVALLGNTPDAFGQVWHVPTTAERLTTRRWIEMIAEEMNSRASVETVPGWMINLLGIFVPLMREFPEMMYQFEMDYVLNSSKFEKRFGIAATSPRDGIREMVKSLGSK